MNKQHFLVKWGRSFTPVFESDLDALIKSEIDKALKSGMQSPLPEPQPLNPIKERYNQGDKIRYKAWNKDKWIQKYSETESTSDTGTTFANSWDFNTNPEDWELFTEPDSETKAQPKPVNPIEEAYERGERVRHKSWKQGSWIQKHSEGKSIDEKENFIINYWDFSEYPERWELYTEPDAETQAKIEGIERHIEKHAKPWVGGYPATDQATDQVQSKFDHERFEAMFRAVVASGEYCGCEIETTEIFLNKLNDFYATKGGNNG